MALSQSVASESLEAFRAGEEGRSGPRFGAAGCCRS
jgi:hypothetical protein